MVGLFILDNLFVGWSEISSVRFRYPFKAEEQLLPQTIECVGDNHFLYASDVSHWDGEFPKSQVAVESP
jgi:predicted TIM-barrel fold metal-dependent hydrolase